MSEIFYHPMKAICPDGKTRTVRVRAYYACGHVALHADTAFSVPARCQVNGKTVTGFVTPEDGYAFFQDHGPSLRFVANSYGKNHRAFFEKEDKRHAARCAFMGHPVTVCVR